MHGTLIKAVATSAIMVLFAVACGDDGGGDDVGAFCDFVTKLDQVEGFPSDEDLDRIKELAPSEISDQVTIVADAFKEQGEAVFDDPSKEVLAAGNEVTAYQEETCTPDADGDG